MSNLSNFLLNIRIIPQVFIRIKNWHILLLDYLGLLRKDYIASIRKGTNIFLRHSTSDKGILKEIFILEEYSPAKEYIKKSGLIVDIGAQIGMFSLYANALNRKAKILSFEPMTENYTLLKKNIKLNKLNNIHAYKYAISGKTGKFALYLSKDNSGGHSLYNKSEKFELINAISINDLFSKFNIKECGLLKLDCEGAEFDIINNISNKNLSKIKAIITEYHYPERVKELTLKLKTNGFEIRFDKHYSTFLAYRNQAD